MLPLKPPHDVNGLDIEGGTVIVADSEEKLQALIDTLKRESENMGLKINTRKTEVLVASKNLEPPHCNILIDGARIKQSSAFVYLGSIISQDARCNKEIERRILIAKKCI